MSEVSRAVAEIRGTDASRCLQIAEFGGGAVVLCANIIQLGHTSAHDTCYIDTVC